METGMHLGLRVLRLCIQTWFFSHFTSMSDNQKCPLPVENFWFFLVPAENSGSTEAIAFLAENFFHVKIKRSEVREGRGMTSRQGDMDTPYVKLEEGKGDQFHQVLIFCLAFLTIFLISGSDISEYFSINFLIVSFASL